MGLFRTPLLEAELPALVLRATATTTPAPARLMVARGLAPMGPRDLCLALYQLALDGDTPVRAAAMKTAADLPERIVQPVLGEALDARVLDFFAERLAERGPLLEQVLLNPATHEETVYDFARGGSERICEAIAVNEERLFRAPKIIEALYFNRGARMSMIDRLVEMAGRRGIALAGIPTSRDFGTRTEVELPAVPASEAGGVDALFSDTLAFGDELETGLAGAAAEEPDEADTTTNLDGGDDLLLKKGGDKAEKKLQQIGSLPVNAKIRLAMLGNSFHRAVLVRDSNKMVAMAAIRSPAVTDQEAVKYAGARSVDDEVIRFISNKKEWMRLYTVKKNLVSNPKCPLPVAVRLLTHLRSVDLKILSTSKNVSSAVATAAKRLAQSRQS
ncbi:MAG: hypothetical protein AABZ30_02080 [Myxococcota bacterium]